MNINLTAEQQISQWLYEDTWRLEALHIAARLHLPQWCIAAGFVRNLVWDKLQGFSSPTPLADIDLIYFNAEDTREETDKIFEEILTEKSALPWSVKNQARMHNKIGVSPYQSTLDAMRYWPEIETAIGASVDQQGHIEIISPFDLEQQVSLTVTVNPKHPSPDTAAQRAMTKGWLTRWPDLNINTDKLGGHAGTI